MTVSSHPQDRARFSIDVDRLDRLYRDHAPGLAVFFARRLLDPSATADLVGETFLAAHSGRQSFRGSTKEDATGWLYGIARNISLVHLRELRSQREALARYHSARVPVHDEIERIDELAEVASLRSAVGAALTMLSPDHQAILDLRVIRELEYKEIAVRLNVSEDVARARVSRGLRALANGVEKKHRPLV